MNEKELAQQMRDLLDEVAEPLDELMDLCREVSFLEAYVPGNVWANRYGYIGKSGLDYLEEWIEQKMDGEFKCTRCGEGFNEEDIFEMFDETGIDGEDVYEADLEGWCPECIRKELV